MDRIVDRTLLLQQEDGLFSPQGGGCEDYDAIDTLVNMYKRVNYGRGDIKFSGNSPPVKMGMRAISCIFRPLV